MHAWISALSYRSICWTRSPPWEVRSRYSSAQQQSISATIPLAALEQLAANSTVYHIAPAVQYSHQPRTIAEDIAGAAADREVQ